MRHIFYVLCQTGGIKNSNCSVIFLSLLPRQTKQQRRGWLREFLIGAAAGGREVWIYRRSPGYVFILFQCCTGVARRMSGKNVGKIDICFYHHCPANRSSKRRGWSGVVLIGATSRRRRFGAAGLLDGLHQCCEVGPPDGLQQPGK